MPKTLRSEESIFAEALDKKSPEECATFLAEACGEDAALRAQVENLLQSHQQAGSFLRRPIAATLDEPVRERPGTVIGPYKLREQIGEGGMGVVFVADQQQPVRRRVALKIIKPGMDSAQVIARFEAESQALAIMNHQNIAKVHDAGTTESGRPYFVMELVHGVPITDYCDANQLAPRRRLELFIPVCQAIQHAHQKGIIHRDIKPSNILVTMYDDKPVPKVIDFGVSKAIEQRLTEKTLYTQFGTLVGTFEYMSPEQAEMNAFGVDTRSDIYSLGVLLYELLTGTTPLERRRLREAAFGEIVRLIKEEEPPRPSVRLSTSDALVKVAAARKTDPVGLSRLVRGELDWVVMRCLEKDRTRRYDTASALARDVQNYLNDEPVEARPPSTWYRLRKAARRNKAALTAAALVAVALLLGTAVSAWQAVRASEAEQEARTNEIAAQDQMLAANAEKEKAVQRSNELAALNEKLRRLTYVADVNLARHAWDEDSPFRMRELLDRHVPTAGEADLRGFEWYYLRRQFHRELLMIKAHADAVTALAYMPDGKRLISFGLVPPKPFSRQRLTWSREVKLWDAESGKELPIRLKGPTHDLVSLTLSPDGKMLAGGNRDKLFRIWDLETGEPTTLTGHTLDWCGKVVLSTDGKYVASMAYILPTSTQEMPRSELLVWNRAQNKELMKIEFPTWALDPAFSPDGKRVAVASYSPNRLRIWDVASGREVGSFEKLAAMPYSLAYSPNGRCLAAACEQEINLFDASTGKLIRNYFGANAALRFGLAFSPDGRRLAAAGVNSGRVEIWDVDSGQLLRTLKTHLAGIDVIAFSPDGAQLASGDKDGNIKIWDTIGDRETVLIPASPEASKEMSLSPGGHIVLTGYGTKAVHLWDAASGKSLGKPLRLEDKLVSSNFTGDGKRLALTDDGNNVTIWDLASNSRIRQFRVDCPLPHPVTSLSGDGKWLALLGPAHTIKVWDVEKGVEHRALKGLKTYLWCSTFSPDGKLLATGDYMAGGDNSSLKIWDLARGEISLTADLKGIWIDMIRFSPDGKRLAITGGYSTETNVNRGEVRILDAKTGNELQVLTGSLAIFSPLAFSLDGGRIAAGGMDGTVKIWDTNDGQELLTLDRVKSGVTQLEFTSDGRRLIGAARDLTVRVWDATPVAE